VAAAGAGLVALGPVILLVAGVVRRVRGGPARSAMAPGVALRAWLLGALSLLTVGALIWYLLAVARLALGYERNVWIVQGGWLAVRVLGIAAVVAGVLLIERARRARESGAAIARGAVAIGSLTATVLGAAVLLVVLAYWGVYQLGI